MMQQQQLATLLTAALTPKVDEPPGGPTPKPSSTSSPKPPQPKESDRLAAIDSLRRLIIYPPNSSLVSHSAPFLSHGFSQLLADKSYAVRQSAATAYGAMCSVLASIPIGSGGRQNHGVNFVDHFMNWALPLLNVSANGGSTELALESLREFLSVGDIAAVERYAYPILKACQELLEDERTSANLLHQILGVITMLSLKFFRCFQPHFVDIVDLLLGWAMVPNLAESDRQVIMGAFLQFQKYWVGNLQFPLGLLTKLLGDMDALLQDGSPGTQQQFRRLLVLFSCFTTILKSTASGLLEINLLQQIIEPLSKMIPKLLGCLLLMGRKFGWAKWIEDSWRCLTLLAEILGEKFSSCYPLALDVLFQSLDGDSKLKQGGAVQITSFQIHGVLKTNLQLLSLLKSGLLPPSVDKILQWDAPVSQLRLHPNHLVTASTAATYTFLLQHGDGDVVDKSIKLLFEELVQLNGMIEIFLDTGDTGSRLFVGDSYSKSEILSLVKFDLKVLLSCICLGGADILMAQDDMSNLLLNRSDCLASFSMTKLCPFYFSVKEYVDLQVTILEVLSRVASVELLSRCSIQLYGQESAGRTINDCVKENQVVLKCLRIIVEHLNKYSNILIKALGMNSPLSVKLKALDWMSKVCQDVCRIYERLDSNVNPYEYPGYSSAVWTLVSSVLGAALDREPQARLQVTRVFDLLLRAKLIHPGHFHQIAELIIEKLGDPDTTIRSAFMTCLSRFLPFSVYLSGSSDSGIITSEGSPFYNIGTRPNLHWRHAFALRQLPQRLQPQHLVSILSYISQRWKAPLSSWIQRLIQLCNSAKDLSQNHSEEAGNSGGHCLWMDIKFEVDVLEKIGSVNDFAGVWWAIHEVARYCTATRLRTNLGGPTQTFAALERMLLDVSHVLQLETQQNDGNISVGSSGVHLLPMRLLLDFVEALKKNVYNAYEGSSVLPSASRQSSLFFQTNKKVCEEWFSRICEPMMNAGLALQCLDATIQYCSLRLQELRNSVLYSSKDKSRLQIAGNPHVRDKLAGDIMRVARYMALALSKKHEPAALIGLQKWLNLTFSTFLEEEKAAINGCKISGPFWWITGLVQQAEGQFEKAAAFYTHVLQTEDSLSSMWADDIQFTIGRVVDSYTTISDWESLESWLSELQALRATHAGKTYSGALTTAGNELNAIHALAHFDEGEVRAAWASLDLTPKSSSELTLDPKLALQRSEQMLLQALLHRVEGKLDLVPDQIRKARSMLDEVLTVFPSDGLSEVSPYAIHLHCIDVLQEDCKLSGIKDEAKRFESVVNSLSQAVDFPLNVINQDYNSWLKLLRVYKTVFPASPVTLRFCKNLIGLARKQKNLRLAGQLRNYLKDQVDVCSDVSCRKYLLSSLRYEEILLMYAENKFADAVTNIWSYVSPCFLSPDSVYSDAHDGQLRAKACLKFSNWLQLDYPEFKIDDVLPHILSEIMNKGTDESCELDKLISKSSTNAIIEEIVGASAKLSTRLCPAMGKSWIAYASWCFSQAKQSLSPSHGTVLYSCSLSHVLDQELLPQRFSLSEDEISRVGCIVSELLGAEHLSEGDSRQLSSQSANDLNNINCVTSAVQKLVNVIEAAAGAPGVEDFGGESLTSAVSSQLQATLRNELVHIDENAAVSAVSDLLSIWWSLRKRRVSLFGHAAHGFVQHLSYSCSKFSICPSDERDCGSFSQKSGSVIMRATLYLLQILLNYGLELKDTLESVLSTVPLLPWQEVTPQLFARLGSHPEPETRKQLESLLMILARSSPWSVVYPTLVDLNASDEQPPQELDRILDCVMKLYPKLVQDVKLMINELGNVTVLWEELWLSTLQDLHGDVMRRVSLLKEEASRIAENVTLSHSEKVKINAAKYSAMMAPVVVALERRLASISRTAETPHEKWFQDEYKESIRSAILAFKSPPASAAALADVWRPFDNIAASLASYQRKSAVSLNEVAPQLACLSSSDIPMPGLEKQAILPESDGDLSTSLGIVTIASFSEQVSILPTKTKPKKLVMFGSDGGKYTYLLKGREDLRLDARIMQLLQAVNSFLHSYSETRNRGIGVRYYSVTPISGRAGLIQWVDNVISIYSIFKSWQQRVQLAQLLASGGGILKTSAPPVPRPSDMFYGKIIPALKEKGIRRVISRRDWPHEVKLKVLLDLMKETPRQLLHQELWCASECFKAFSSKMKRYSGSLAAMSMVGHILGLGDRHLDNILIDFLSGDIVHIDYNVCFEKGRRLKVPEIVPFRLTQMLEAALGLTGVEGGFRASCEAIIGVLRKNKDILLMLLEVFVWDPLVEWTRGDFHDDAAIGGEERKGMETAVSLSLFASRVQEIRVPLQEHHDLLLACVPAIVSALERFLNILNQYEMVSTVYYRADQERSSILLHEASAKSLVAEATSQSEKTRAFYEVQGREYTQAKAALTEKAQEAATWLEQHGRFLDALRSDSISEMNATIQESSMEDSLSLISAVSVAGVPLSIVPEPTQAQCHDIDRDISRLIADLDHGVSCAVSALQAYSIALQRFLPLNYVATSPVHSWAQVLQLSINTLSPDVLSMARRQASELASKVQGENLDFVRHTRDELCLNVKRYALEIEKLEEERAGLVNSIGSEAESKAKDRILSAFMKYVQSSGFVKNEDLFPSLPHEDFKHESRRDVKVDRDLKKEKMFCVLYAALVSLYDDMKHKLLNSFYNAITEGVANSQPQTDFMSVFCNVEEQVEKCALVLNFVNELRDSVGDAPASSEREFSERNWASVFKGSLLSCKELIIQMTEFILPELIKAMVSIDSEVIDALGALSTTRGSIETALEQLVEVAVERGHLEELENNYFVKVGLVTEQQLALEEAAMKGRDHLSWEEAEELASQEEACRAQLDQLHLKWNQKDARSSSLIKKEADIKDALVSSERHFLSLLGSEGDGISHGLRSRFLLHTLDKPFSGLESLDKALSAYCGVMSCHRNKSDLAINVRSGCPISDYIWKFEGLLYGMDFFTWKVAVMDLVLEMTIHEASSSVDRNLGMDQLVDAIKKKLVVQLQVVVRQYLKDRVVPRLFHCLDKEIERLRQHLEGGKELVYDRVKDTNAVKRVKVMLEEYCNAHETVRAARSAASAMTSQINELKEAGRKTNLEIIQMEWMHDITLAPSHDIRFIAHRFLETSDKMYHLVSNISRPNLLESMQSAVAKIAGSIESFKSCERVSVAAEGQLERAMNWACGGPNSGMSGNTQLSNAGIPPEFHDHLKQRRQLLWETQEKAGDILKVSVSVLEFEASRDGILAAPGDIFPFRTSGGGRSWQQAYLNALTRMELTFHAFSRCEQEWKLAQSSVEAASNGLFAVSSELSVASLKAKAASGELQSTLLQMRDCAYESSIALTSFSGVAKGHTALTSECGSMLEEVLAISDGLHDVHNLGKEAVAVHRSMMDYLLKAYEIIFPLDSVLSKDVAAMTDAMAKERETKLEISPIHGQAIYQSYSYRLKDASHAFEPLVSPLVSSVKELYSLLTRLAQLASLHAGNIHKAVEGVEGATEAKSQDLNMSSEELVGAVTEYGELNENIDEAEAPNEEASEGDNLLTTQDKGWISPPESMYSSSSEMESMSGETSPSNSSSIQEAMEHLCIDDNHKKDVNHIQSLQSPETYQPERIHSGLSQSIDIEAKSGGDDSSLNIQVHNQAEGVQLPNVLPTAENPSILEEEDFEVKLENADEATSFEIVGSVDDRDNDRRVSKDGARINKGRNDFAMSVLRRIEMKVDGRDIAENREVSTREQVDYLLKQATSTDNLCNMYEGWTPWI